MQCFSYQLIGRFFLIESEYFIKFRRNFCLVQKYPGAQILCAEAIFQVFLYSSHQGCGLGSISFSAPSAASSKSLSCQQFFCLDISSNIFSISELWQDYLQDILVAQTGKHFSHFASWIETRIVGADDFHICGFPFSLEFLWAHFRFPLGCDTVWPTVVFWHNKDDNYDLANSFSKSSWEYIFLQNLGILLFWVTSQFLSRDYCAQRPEITNG